MGDVVRIGDTRGATADTGTGDSGHDGGGAVRRLWITREDACAELGVSGRTLARMVRRGEALRRMVGREALYRLVATGDTDSGHIGQETPEGRPATPQATQETPEGRSRTADSGHVSSVSCSSGGGVCGSLALAAEPSPEGQPDVQVDPVPDARPALAAALAAALAEVAELRAELGRAQIFIDYFARRADQAEAEKRGVLEALAALGIARS